MSNIGEMAGSESAQASAASRFTDVLADTGEGNLLVSGPPLVGKSAFALDVLTTARDRDRDALLVTSTRSAARLLDDFEGVTVVDCTPAEVNHAQVTSVGSPADLTGISMPVSEFLHEATRPVVVLDSVSALLMYAENANAFRFLSVLTTHVANANGLGLFTLNEASHDEETLQPFVQLFDGRVEFREGDDREFRAVDVDTAPDGWHPY